MPEFLTKDDVAGLFRISPRTVERWVQQGRLPPALKLSAKIIRWKATSIEQALEEANIEEPKPAAQVGVES